MGRVHNNRLVFVKFWMLFIPISLCACLVMESPRTNLWGQEPIVLDSRIDALIAQLGANRFQDRELASSELFKIGEPAIIALTAAERSGTAEIRQRAATIRARLDDEVFDNLSASFLRDTKLPQSHTLPGWRSFSEVIGSPRSSKLLFIAMVREQRALAKMIESLDEAKRRPNRDQAEVVNCKEKLKLACEQLAERMRVEKKFEVPDVGDTLALMLSAIVLEGQVPVDVHGLIYGTLVTSNIREHLRRPGYRECLLRIMGAWIPLAPDPLAYEVLSLANVDGISTGVSVAKRVLTESKLDDNPLQEALLCLAKFGLESDIPLAEKLLGNESIIWETPDDGRIPNGILLQNIAPPGGQLPNRPAAPNEPPMLRVRMSDLALAVCMKLADQDLTRAFPRFSLAPDLELRLDNLAFPDSKPALREQAFKMWRQSRDSKQPPPAS